MFQVRFNPYSFRLEIDDLKISDTSQRQVAGCSFFVGDLELESIMEMAFVLSSFKLCDPQVLLIIDEDGVTNFQKALDANQSPKPVPAVEEDKSLPKLFFTRIGIENVVV